MRWLTDWMGVTGDCHVVQYTFGGFEDSCEHALIGWIGFGVIGALAVAAVVGCVLIGLPDED